MKRFIEKELRKILDTLKPELKNRVFLFDDKIEYMEGVLEGDAKRENYYRTVVLGRCNMNMKPPVIRFYLGSLEKHIREYLEGIVKHEMVHSFEIRDEWRAHQQDKELSINIFDENNNYKGSCPILRAKRIKRGKEEN